MHSDVIINCYHYGVTIYLYQLFVINKILICFLWVEAISKMSSRYLNVIQLKDNVVLKEKNGIWTPDGPREATLEGQGIVLGETLAQNDTSKIKKAFCKNLKESVTVKIIRKDKLTPKLMKKFVWREICILQHLKHPSIVSTCNSYVCCSHICSCIFFFFKNVVTMYHN